MDSTLTNWPRWLLALAALAVIWGWHAAPARADGDPASDVLVTQSLFLPQDGAVPAKQQAQLTSLVQSAARRGYPIRVAMIASASDLGSVTALWRRPQSYAAFLGEELSLVYHGPLLVVMPDGFGVYRVPAQTATALAGVNATHGGLGTVTLTAVQRLAAAAGHPLPVSSAAVTAKPAGSGNGGAWIAFALGVLLVAGAWTASLRAKPMQLRRRTT
jgi:hypothetical protein